MDETAPEYYRLVAGYYAIHDGPYLLGDRVTYGDFVIYQSLHNDIKTGTLPVGSSLAGLAIAGRVSVFTHRFSRRSFLTKLLNSGKRSRSELILPSISKAEHKRSQGQDLGQVNWIMKALETVWYWMSHWM